MTTQQNEYCQNSNNNHYYYSYGDEYEYEDDYEYNDYYDECDFDPRTNKLRVNTFSAEKKIKQKIDPFVETHRQTMKIVNRINHRNYWNVYQQQRRNCPLLGIIVIDGKELFLGTICGNFKKEIFSKSNRFRSGKHNKGGQSAQRFGRIYDNKINHFVKECAIQINKLFGNQSILQLDGIILAGNGNMKNKLFQSKVLETNSIKSHITKTVNAQGSGRNGFEEIFKKLQDDKINEIGKNKDIEIIQKVLAMAEDENQCTLLSIGVDETIRAIKAKITKYVVLTNDGFKYVIKKRNKAIKWLKNEDELHEYIRNMNISFNAKNRAYKLAGFMEYMINLCRINKVELKQVINDSEIGRKFVNDYSGCIGVLYQSSDLNKAN